MTRKNKQDNISFLLLWQDFLSYRLSAVKGDLRAGLTVALLALPQAVGYALIAGLPPSVGIYSMIIACILTSSFSSSILLISGATSAIAILMQSAISEVLLTYYREVDVSLHETLAVQIAIQLTLLVGLFQVLAAILRLGRLTHFISRSVVTGYIAGVSFAILVSQSFYFLGLAPDRGSSFLFQKLIYLSSHAELVHWPTALIGIFSLILLLGISRLKKSLPAPLLMLSIVSLLLAAFGVTGHQIALIKDTGTFTQLLPAWNFPFFDLNLLNQLVPMAFVISLIGILEMSSVAKSMVAVRGSRFSVNQDIMSLGIGNIFTSFFGGMPCSVSPSRSHLNYNAGARTRFAGIFCGLSVAVIVGVSWPLVSRIPLTALSALLCVTAIRMIPWSQLLLCLRTTREDAVVLIITIVSCICFSLDIAFYLGIGLSLTLFLRKTAVPYFMEYGVNEEGVLFPIEKYTGEVSRQICLMTFEGEFFFGSVQIFQEKLQIHTEETKVPVIILDLKNARDLDATACHALLTLHRYLAASDRSLVLAGVSASMLKVLQRSGVASTFGKKNIFLFDIHEPTSSAIAAWKHAESFVDVALTPAAALSPWPCVGKSCK